MNTNSKPIRISIVAAVALLLCCVAQAGVLYEVPLTSSAPGVNPGVNAPSRTNDAYNPTNNGVSPDLLGGDAINASGLFWTVDSLTVWAGVYPAVGSTGQTPSPDEYTSLALYGGDAGVATATLVGTATTASESQVGYSSSYDGSTNYHSSGGNYYGIWQVTFSGLSISIGPGVDYAFAVKDTSGTPHDVQLHATACPGGNPNNCIRSGIVDFVQAGSNYTVNGVFTNLDDVNVILTGTETPEPTTWLLFGVGIGVLGLVRRPRG